MNQHQYSAVSLSFGPGAQFGSPGIERDLAPPARHMRPEVCFFDLQALPYKTMRMQSASGHFERMDGRLVVLVGAPPRQQAFPAENRAYSQVPQERAAPSPFEDAHRLSQTTDVRAAVSLLMRALNERLVREEFGACDTLLRQASVETLAPELSLAALVITAPASDLLPSRSDFFERVSTHLRATMPEGAADRALAHLR